MLLLSMFSFIIGMTHISNSLLNCKVTMLWMITITYVFIFIEKSFNFQNSNYVIIFSLKYFCSFLISFILNIYKYTSSGYPFTLNVSTFIHSYTADLVSIYRYLYHKFLSISIFTFTKKNTL